MKRLLATLLLIPVGFAMPFNYSPSVIMGQNYLPNHIGLSSGITLGVSIAIGGIAAPIVGKVADIHGIRYALTTLTILPVIAAGIAFTLPNPKKSSGQ